MIFDDWTSPLKQMLNHLKTNSPLRIAVMGIGHELRGDDAAGIMIARALVPLFVHQPNVLIIDGGHAPENQTGPLRRFMPDFVLLVDCARMGLTGGAIRWLTWWEMSGLSGSTHTLPLNMVAQYLRDRPGCEVALIGIQPVNTGIGAELSLPVQASVNEIVKMLMECLTDYYG